MRNEALELIRQAIEGKKCNILGSKNVYPSLQIVWPTSQRNPLSKFF